MNKYSSQEYANPSSLYKEGVSAKKALGKGKEVVAHFLHAHPDEIVFTCGGTETNNLALRGTLEAFLKGKGCIEDKGEEGSRDATRKPHLIISSIEHSSIMETADILEKQGVEVTRLSVDASGAISLDELKRSIRPDTFLVSIMAVNNEVGTIQPIYEIAKIVKHARAITASTVPNLKYPLFHTDASQALYEELNMEKIGADLLTLDSGKFYGPRGIGCLYLRRGTPIEPIIYGGGQEKGIRSGTENIPAIMGFAKAVEIIDHSKVAEKIRMAGLKKLFIEKLKAMRPDIMVNGNINGDDTSPHILNISISGIDNEFFILQLDAKGICCSTKSSCLRDEGESYVLRAIKADNKTSIRFSFGRWTERKDILKTADIIKGILHHS
jgi:cysteine desulfurase